MSPQQKIITVAELMQQSGVTFGTSGVRGRVVDMSDMVCWVYTTGFLNYLTSIQAINKGDKIGIAGDLRASTQNIMAVITQAITDSGFQAINFGTIPTPALSLYGFQHGFPTIMITGSHIPDDRNGIKFNTATGEISKTDEQPIKAQQVIIPAAYFDNTGKSINPPALSSPDLAAENYYIQRFTDFFPKKCLSGKNIGLYQHSSVARDCIQQILQQLGATVTVLGRSNKFIAVDTEAIRPEDTDLALKWAQEYDFDCIISTDGDGDRPLISDENGNWLRGDIAGILCAQYFQADVVVTPVSSNSVLELSHIFPKSIRTKIGSPYVIAAMQTAINPHNKVVGYEANGGFLSATTLTKYSRQLTALPTRDAVIVPLALIMLAIEQQQPISKLISALPPRYTASNRLKNFPQSLSKPFFDNILSHDIATNLTYIHDLTSDFAGNPVDIDATDGIRIKFDNGNIIHFRASGNAPELRCYTESSSIEKALKLNQLALKSLQQKLGFNTNVD